MLEIRQVAEVPGDLVCSWLHVTFQRQEQTLLDHSQSPGIAAPPRTSAVPPTTTPNQESSPRDFQACSRQDRPNGLSGPRTCPRERASFHDLALHLRGAGFWGPYHPSLGSSAFPNRLQGRQSSRVSLIQREAGQATSPGEKASP